MRSESGSISAATVPSEKGFSRVYQTVRPTGHPTRFVIPEGGFQRDRGTQHVLQQRLPPRHVVPSGAHRVKGEPLERDAPRSFEPPRTSVERQRPSEPLGTGRSRPVRTAEATSTARPPPSASPSREVRVHEGTSPSDRPYAPGSPPRRVSTGAQRHGGRAHRFCPDMRRREIALERKSPLPLPIRSESASVGLAFHSIGDARVVPHRRGALGVACACFR